MERPRKFIFKVIKISKKYHGCKKNSVLIGENEISYFKINERKNNLWKIYMIMDY
jgi:hypothetical protein